MKKILLTLIALMSLGHIYAQSLSMVIVDHKTGEDVATINSGESYNVGSLWNGFMDDGIYFALKNNSGNAGESYIESWKDLNGNCSMVMICFGANCYPDAIQATKNKPFNLPANGEFRDDVDFTFVGTGKVKLELNFKFTADAEPSVFTLEFELGEPSGIESALDVNNSLKLYQEGEGLALNYNFSDSKDRSLSLVSLSGEVLYTQKLADTMGDETLPLNLDRGVYLYVLNENGVNTMTRKFIVK